jgi:SNF2 family DNA or RNA helicase
MAQSRIGMSGTPLRNKFENAWAIVRWIFPEYMKKKFYAWRITECETRYHPFAPQNREVIGELEPGKLVNSLPVYIQHKQREKCCEFHPEGFLVGLEPPEEIIRTVQMTPKQKKFYKQMEEHYVAWLTTPDESGELPVVASLPIVARGMLRFCALGLPSVDPDTNKLYFEDDCESPKIDELLDVLSDMGNQTAIIFTHSQKFASVVTHRLDDAGITAFEWSGLHSQRVRDAAMERFIAGEIRCVVAVISAIGTGTDGLQEATNVEIWLSEDEDGTTNEQARGRTDRPGQQHQVVRIKIQAEDTFDEGIVSKQLENALKMSASLRKEHA